MAVAAELGTDENVRDGGNDGLGGGHDPVTGGLWVKVHFQWGMGPEGGGSPGSCHKQSIP